jgi:hypothetical protein
MEIILPVSAIMIADLVSKSLELLENVTEIVLD